MDTITYAQVQELVTRISIVKLPIAYELLAKLAQERVDKLSPQQQFSLLSFEEQQHMLEQQAAEMVEHYTARGRYATFCPASWQCSA